MSLLPTINDFKPIYNLVELELEDYEENELKDLKTCFEKVGFKCFFEKHFELKALEEHELELFIKSQLISFEISDEKLKNKTQKHIYKYNYNSFLLLCKPTYLKLCEINDYLLCILQNHLQLNRLTEHVHGNTRCVSKTDSRVFLDLAITFPIKQFLVQYGTIYRFSSPLRHQDDSGIFIYLPTS
ncbi:9166_t:CDS:2 [Dentiscutata heterogama]|uniref:9166_t:CDS:1 n=1 Tax=Dentiscutata heterogama TaxID=1316150 RepID=A0ACA9MX39_9GLOM|nr:9166_t:CDS:2 [Dentiscutata heterogama]